MIHELIRREAEAWSRHAALFRGPDSDTSRRTAVILRRLAGVTEAHGLAGLHGFMSCRAYSTSVTDPTKHLVEDTIRRILNGETQ